MEEVENDAARRKRRPGCRHGMSDANPGALGIAAQGPRLSVLLERLVQQVEVDIEVVDEALHDLFLVQTF